MSTKESPVVHELWELIHIYVHQAKNGGSVPNLATELQHSYHRSWQDSPHDDGYSVHYWGDKHRLGGKTEYACALDITFHEPSDMSKYTSRFRNWAESSRKLPGGIVGLREFAGTIDGKNVFAMDVTGKPRRTFGWDDSHLWHIHLSFNRRNILDRRLLRIATFFAP